MGASSGTLRLLVWMVLTSVHWKMGSFIIQMENRREEVDTGTGKMQEVILGMTLYPSSSLWMVSGFLTCLILCPELLFYEKPEINWYFSISTSLGANWFHHHICRRFWSLQPGKTPNQDKPLPAGTSHSRMVLGKLCSPLQSSHLQRLKSPFSWAGRRFYTDVTNCATTRPCPCGRRSSSWRAV